MKLYVASSWRNPLQPTVVAALRGRGHEVYDFRNPAPGKSGFAWSDIDAAWQQWTPGEFRDALKDPVAQSGYNADWQAMQWADAGVLVMPCGRSAHLEAGYFVGAGKPLLLLLSDGEPELMYKMANYLCLSVGELLEAVEWCRQGLLRLSPAPESPEDVAVEVDRLLHDAEHADAGYEFADYMARLQPSYPGHRAAADEAAARRDALIRDALRLDPGRTALGWEHTTLAPATLSALAS